MKKQFLALIGLMMALTLVLSACGTPAVATSAAPAAPAAATEVGEVKIGIWEPLTGDKAGGGAQDLEGYQLGNKLRPTVLGKKVTLVIADNKSDKVEAANSIQRLVEKDKVDFVLGPWGSSLALAGIDITEKAGIPIIVAASNLNITNGRYWVIRSAYADPFAGSVVANYAAKTLKAKTAVIVSDVTQDYSVTLSTFFKKSFIEATGNPNAIIGEVKYSGGDQDFTAQLNEVKKLNPDVLFLPSYYQDLALFAIQKKEMGITTPIVAGDAALAPELISIGKDAVEGIVINAHFSPDQAADNPLAAAFVKAFQAEYNKLPSSDNAVAFTNYNLMLDAIEKAGSVSNKKGVMEFLRNLTNYPSVTGNITMDPKAGTPSKSAPVLIVKDGQFKYLTTVNP